MSCQCLFLSFHHPIPFFLLHRYLIWLPMPLLLLLLIFLLHSRRYLIQLSMPLILPTPLSNLLCPWPVSHLTQIGLFIIWEIWMSYVLIVELCTGHLKSWSIRLSLACAVSVERLKSQNSMIHHQSFSIFSQAKRIYARNFVIVFGIITMHWQ
jgi:hypothetical protein